MRRQKEIIGEHQTGRRREHPGSETTVPCRNEGGEREKRERHTISKRIVKRIAQREGYSDDENRYGVLFDSCFVMVQRKLPAQPMIHPGAAVFKQDALIFPLFERAARERTATDNRPCRPPVRRARPLRRCPTRLRPSRYALAECEINQRTACPWTHVRLSGSCTLRP